MAGWSMAMGRLFREPPAGQPAARRRRGRSCARTASRATTSSASTGSRAAIRCRSGWRRRRSSPSPPATTTRRRSRRSSRSSPSCISPGSIRRPAEALDAASVVRRPTLSLLAAMLPGRRAAGRLRPASRPPVRRAEQRRPRHPRHGPRGRRRVPPGLRSRSLCGATGSRPGASSGTRSRARRRRRCGATPPTCCTSSRTRRPRGVLPDDGAPLLRRAGARPADWPAIQRSRRGAEPPESVAILAEWWRRAPDAFRVARDGAGHGRGLLRGGRARPGASARCFDVDPVARRLARPPPAPARSRAASACCSFASSASATIPTRRSSSRRSSSISSGMYMELRPELRRIYNVAARAVWRRRRRGRGSASGQSPVSRSGSTASRTTLHVLDFGPASVDGWLTRIVATELQIEEDSILDVGAAPARPRRPAGRPHEARVRGVQYLYERRGQVVERCVAAARRLGLRLRRRQQRHRGARHVAATEARRPAAAIETVRGLGYRFVLTA